MRLFLSLLTVYTYPGEESRVPLNRQEAAKFLDAFQEAYPSQKLLILSDMSREELEGRLGGLTEAERSDFQMVLRIVGKRSPETVNWMRLNLLDYRQVKEITQETLRMMLGGLRGDVEIYANLGCGRKVASIAVYTALMELAHSGDFYTRMRSCKFRVRPYQVEEGKVTEFPVLPVKSISVEMSDAMEMLMATEGGVGLESLRDAVHLPQKEFDRALAYLRKFGYVEFSGGKIRPTVRGSTLLRVWKALGR